MYHVEKSDLEGDILWLKKDKYFDWKLSFKVPRYWWI